jgi:(p)ppGpp synthase/HD superfamily hydrolase
MLLSHRFEEALGLAFRLHAAQERKISGVPYVTHLLAVAAIVLEYGGSEDEAIAALLHDGPEDQGGTECLEDIRMRFGDEVARIVADCSDSFVKPKPPWRERKAHHLRHLASAGRSSALVSAADKLHNARAILLDLRESGTGVWDRFKGGKDGTLWYYREILGVLRDRIPAGLEAEIARTIAEVETLAGPSCS